MRALLVSYHGMRLDYARDSLAGPLPQPRFDAPFARTPSLFDDGESKLHARDRRIASGVAMHSHAAALGFASSSRSRFSALACVARGARGRRQRVGAAQRTRSSAYLPGIPRRALAEIATLLPRADATPNDRRRLLALQGQALVLAGQDRQGPGVCQPPRRRSEHGPRSTGPRHRAARAKRGPVVEPATPGWPMRWRDRRVPSSKGADDPFHTHWALIAIGTTARARGRLRRSDGRAP